MEQLIQYISAHPYLAGSVVLEQWPHPPELLLQARERLLQLFAVAE